MASKKVGGGLTSLWSLPLTHQFYFPRLCRAYPEGLGVHLIKAWRQYKDLPRAGLRQKLPLNSAATDREMFESMELGDTWAEAEIIQVWCYLYRNSQLRIPDSWEHTLRRFHETVSEHALGSVGTIL